MDFISLFFYYNKKIDLRLLKRVSMLSFFRYKLKPVILSVQLKRSVEWSMAACSVFSFFAYRVLCP